MSRYKIITVFTVIVVAVFVLHKCGTRNTAFVDDGQRADVRMDTILEAFREKDKEALKGMFSERALEQGADIDIGTNYLFDFFQGEIQSCEQDKWCSQEKTTRGKKRLELCSWYTVTTDKNKYLVFAVDYPKDAIDPGNVGLYTLRIIYADDVKSEFTAYWQDMALPGIYIPDEEPTL